MRVPAFLTDQQIPFEILFHPPAFTAQRRAKYLGVSGERVAKTVLLRGPQGYLLAVLPATQNVDTQALGLTLGGPVRLAIVEEVAELFRDCEWGVTSPFGSLYGVLTVLEESIPREAWMVFEAHRHAEAIRLRCADYEQLERPRRLRFACRSRPDA
jgi:Ala-tRNA(Pro) deacylase